MYLFRDPIPISPALNEVLRITIHYLVVKCLKKTTSSELQKKIISILDLLNMIDHNHLVSVTWW